MDYNVLKASSSIARIIGNSVSVVQSTRSSRKKQDERLLCVCCVGLFAYLVHIS